MADRMVTGRRKMRACLLCSRIETEASFTRHGCPNCNALLGFKGDVDRMAACTSAHYEGTIALMQPASSWVARWQRIERMEKGIYAVQVVGRLPPSIEDDLIDRGINYRPRDGSVRD